MFGLARNIPHSYPDPSFLMGTISFFNSIYCANSTGTAVYLKVKAFRRYFINAAMTCHVKKNP